MAIDRRRAAILWFVAAALFVVAGASSYAKDGELKWASLLAGAALAAMGVVSWRRPRS